MSYRCGQIWLYWHLVLISVHDCTGMNHHFHVQAEVATPWQYSFEEGRRQVICCLLAAHAMCQLPLDLDLTDGKQHHLLRLRGDQLLVYEGCTPKQVSQTCCIFYILYIIGTKHHYLRIC